MREMMLPARRAPRPPSWTFWAERYMVKIRLAAAAEAACHLAADQAGAG